MELCCWLWMTQKEKSTTSWNFIWRNWVRVVKMTNLRIAHWTCSVFRSKSKSGRHRFKDNFQALQCIGTSAFWTGDCFFPQCSNSRQEGYLIDTVYDPWESFVLTLCLTTNISQYQVAAFNTTSTDAVTEPNWNMYMFSNLCAKQYTSNSVGGWGAVW